MLISDSTLDCRHLLSGEIHYQIFLYLSKNFYKSTVSFSIHQILFVNYESTLFFASLWYFPWLVKPDRAFPYQKFHIGNQPTSHHIGHTIWWLVRPCSQERIRTPNDATFLSDVMPFPHYALPDYFLYGSPHLEHFALLEITSVNGTKPNSSI